MSTRPSQDQDIRAFLLKPESKEANPKSVGQFQYVVDLLLEIGPMQERNPITWGEIKNYSELSGMYVSSWEARTIRALSKTFSAAVNEYDGKQIPCPIYTQPGMRQPVTKEKIRGALRAAAPAETKK